MNQYTVKEVVSISGIGLHSGENVNLKILPSVIDKGIEFKVDNELVLANYRNVKSTNRRTTIGNGNIEIHTIEHLMAALYSTNITNAIIEMDSYEPPILDGSSKQFVDAINNVGVVDQEKELRSINIDRKITFDLPSQDIYLTALPFEGFKISYIIDYPNCKGIPNEIYSIDLSDIFSNKRFYDEISSARTFCVTSELIDLIDSKIIKGAGLDNGIAFVDDLDDNKKKKIIDFYDLDKSVFNETIINNSELRFKNEAIRHKVLDLIGDLYLLGRPIKGHIIAQKSGHSSNVEFIKKIAKEYKVNHNLKTYKYDINDILKILHHRYPFLLIDEISELVPNKSVKAIKNVTFNEPYFQGHFPGKAIMPGVLIIEAMAQSGGFLLLHTVEDPEKKLVIFSRINSAKFKKMVQPGDQVVFDIELVSYKMNSCKLSGKAMVNDEIVAESEFMATVTDKEF